MAKVDIAKKKVITGEFRVSYPWVFKKQPPAKGTAAPEDGGKFSCTMIFSKADEESIADLKRAAFWAKTEKWGPDQKAWPNKKNTPSYKDPFHDGDKDLKKKPEYAGAIYLCARSTTKPGIVDAKERYITVESDFYAGCYARAELIAHAFDNQSKGVGFTLLSLQKTRDGEQLGGREPAHTVFGKWGDADDDSEDEENYEEKETEEDSMYT